MKIDELDEWQGLTADMVREWLDKHEWEVCLLGNGSTDAKKRFSDRISVLGCDWDSCLGWLLTRVAAVEQMSVQTLLREINPRMRGPGYPSDAAARAHGDGSWWVFQHQAGANDPRNVVKPGELHMAQMCLSAASNDVRFYWERGLMGEPCDEACLWWPCDASGNKVRWPVDAEGNML